MCACVCVCVCVCAYSPCVCVTAHSVRLQYWASPEERGLAFATTLHSQTQRMFCQLYLISFQTLCIPSWLAQQLLLKTTLSLSPLRLLPRAAPQVVHKHSIVPLGFLLMHKNVYNAPCCCLCILCSHVSYSSRVCMKIWFLHTVVSRFIAIYIVPQQKMLNKVWIHANAAWNNTIYTLIYSFCYH